MSDATGLAEALLGLPGFLVLEVSETADELTIVVETVTRVVGCGRCGARAEAHDRKPVAVRDLACFGRPARLAWRKRRGGAPIGTATPGPGPSAPSMSTPRR
jgi:transposase